MAKSSQKKAFLKALRNGNDARIVALLEGVQPPGEPLHANLIADPAENTVLHRAARWGHAKVVEALLAHGGDPKITNKFGMTPLHHAANHGSGDVMRALIAAGGKPNHADDEKRTPLHWAAGHAFVDAVQVLLEDGRATATVTDKMGFTPIHRACQGRMPSPKSDQEEPVPTLEEEDEARAKIVHLLLSHGADGRVREMHGNQTPLHLCSMNGYVKTAKVLIQEGKGEVNVTNKLNQTPLMYAVTEGHVELVRLMLDHKADVNKINPVYWDWTALHYAIMRDDPDLVQVLLDAGADPQQRDAAGRVAKVVAGDHFKHNVMNLL